MLKVKLDKDRNIAILTPTGKLQEQDFLLAAETIDPWIEANNQLNGLVIYTQKFPGWDSFGDMLAHLKFIRDHHQKINRIAFVSDSSMLRFVEPLADHFTSAELKAFPFTSIKDAIDWASSD